MLGWLVWRLGKRAAKKKARGAIPGRGDTGGGSRAGVIASALAVLGGALWFWRRRRDDLGDEIG